MEKHAADWKYVTYLVFDAPQRSQKGLQYEQRVAWLEANIQPQSETIYAAVVGVCKCTGRDHLNKLLKQVRQSRAAITIGCSSSGCTCGRPVPPRPQPSRSRANCSAALCAAPCPHYFLLRSS